MRSVPLGSQGLTVSRLGLGCMGMSEFYGRATTRESIATIHRALELGVTLLDTADMYGPFTNEELVGRAIADRRDDVVAGHEVRATSAARTARSSASAATPEYVSEACDASLQPARASTTSTSTTSTASTRGRRSRRPSAPWPSSSPRARSATSACPRRRPRRSGAPTPCTRSPPSRPSTRSGRAIPRPRSCPTVRELGIGFVPYSPLGRGFLTGTLRTLDGLAEDDFRHFQPRFQGDNLEANVAIVERIDALARARTTPRRRRSRWPGSSRRATTSCRSRARSAATLPRGERRARSTSS